MHFVVAPVPSITLQGASTSAAVKIAARSRKQSRTVILHLSGHCQAAVDFSQIVHSTSMLQKCSKHSPPRHQSLPETASQQ